MSGVFEGRDTAGDALQGVRTVILMGWQRRLAPYEATWTSDDGRRLVATVSSAVPEPDGTRWQGTLVVEWQQTRSAEYERVADAMGAVASRLPEWIQKGADKLAAILGSFECALIELDLVSGTGRLTARQEAPGRKEIPYRSKDAAVADIRVWEAGGRLNGHRILVRLECDGVPTPAEWSRDTAARER